VVAAQHSDRNTVQLPQRPATTQHSYNVVSDSDSNVPPVARERLLSQPYARSEDTCFGPYR